VNCELNCYYCPNCLFEVPSANIRAQKNRWVVLILYTSKDLSTRKTDPSIDLVNLLDVVEIVSYVLNVIIH
jgi:dissimilatory sulfite reductase (desulfoviridin) alpha/beta subunit